MLRKATNTKKLNIDYGTLQMFFGMCIVFTLLMAFVSPATCDDIFESAKTAAKSLEENIYNAICVIFPVVLIVDLVLMLFTHNEKKLQMLKTIAIGACVVFLIIVGIHHFYNADSTSVSGWFEKIFTNSDK